ncbi:MAG: tyrosyl-tRNA synthetase [Candidatus Woesearchaeota archaeon]|nr:tyrosyl-tRNA synthetase [Candidatus Woesearchaeota archaeon]
MDFETRYNLVTRNLQEVITEDELKELLKTKETPSVYWGTMPTGSISLAYFFPMLKISDLLKAGFRVKILLADLHAALDGVPWDLLEKRTEYYKEAIVQMLNVIGVDINKLEFVRGSEIQLKGDYFKDVLRLSTISSIRICKKSAAEVVKTSENPKLASLIYPLMQALDEVYLEVDAQYGGLDQRKIMVYAREYLPKIGYKPRVEIISPMIRGLVGEKMSSSVEQSKIDLLDDEEKIKWKIRKAECAEGDPNNGIISLVRYLIMILKQDRNEPFVIERPEKYGGTVEYKTYEELEKDFVEKKLYPLDLKNAVTKEVIKLLKPFRENKKLLKLHEEAYPQ